MSEQLLLEMGRVGKVSGWCVEIYSNGHNPPHFHFGPIHIGLCNKTPKNITELRSLVFEKDRSKVSDAMLSGLLRFLNSPYHNLPKVSNYEMLQAFWKSFEELRTDVSTLNETEDETMIQEMLEVVGCNENERKNK